MLLTMRRENNHLNVHLVNNESATLNQQNDHLQLSPTMNVADTSTSVMSSNLTMDQSTESSTPVIASNRSSIQLFPPPPPLTPSSQSSSLAAPQFGFYNPNSNSTQSFIHHHHHHSHLSAPLSQLHPPDSLSSSSQTRNIATIPPVELDEYVDILQVQQLLLDSSSSSNSQVTTAPPSQNSVGGSTHIAKPRPRLNMQKASEYAAQMQGKIKLLLLCDAF